MSWASAGEYSLHFHSFLDGDRFIVGVRTTGVPSTSFTSVVSEPLGRAAIALNPPYLINALAVLKCQPMSSSSAMEPGLSGGIEWCSALITYLMVRDTLAPSSLLRISVRRYISLVRSID